MSAPYPSIPIPVTWTALCSQETPSSLSLCAMSLVVKHLFTIPGTLARLRWGAALTIPGTPVAWSRWGKKAGMISHSLTALEYT